MSPGPHQESDVLSLLANRRRRSIVLALTAVGACDVDTLASLIVALDDGQIDDVTDAAAVRQIRNNLRNRHLTRLESAGIINWTDREVSPGPTFAVALRTLAASWTQSLDG